jgi:hypothetical protein
MRLEDNTQEAQVTTVNTKTKKNMKKSPLKRKLNPLTSNIHTHSFDQNKKPRSSLKAKISPKTSSSQKHVTFSKATL